MSEDLIFVLLAVILLFGAGGTLLKLYVLDKMQSEKLFENLKKQGFQEVALENQAVIAILDKYKLKKGNGSAVDTIKSVIAQRKEGRTRYLCDVHRKTHKAGGGYRYEHYSLFVEIRPVSVDYEVIIRPKLPRMAESIMALGRSGRESTQGLREDFKEKFSVASKSRDGVALSQELQMTFLQNSEEFPFNQIRGPITPILHISPEGWSVIANRITKKKNLDTLLIVADKFTRIL